LEKAEGDEKFIALIIKEDETCLEYAVETQQQSSHWKWKSSPRQEKALLRG
jgi:hypothetical protein